MLGTKRRLQAKLRAADGDRVTVREGGPAGGRRPFGPAEVDAMSGAQSISTRRAYGVQRVCRVWHRARSSVYARRQATRSPALCVAAGRSALPRTTSWWPTFAGCSKPRRFMARATERAWAKMREGAGAPVDARARPPSPAARGATRMGRRRTDGTSPPRRPT